MTYLSGREGLHSLEAKHNQEVRDRLTAVKHVQVEHFSEHANVEGYVGSTQMEEYFGCDRLMKMETMFTRMQLGYNPNRNKSFLVMNLKTSRYDTVASQYQKEIREEEMKSMNRNGFQNRVFASKRKADAAVLIEKSDTRPWSEATIRPHFGRNLEALQKTMPFFSKMAEKEKISNNRMEQKGLQKSVQENINKGSFYKNIELRKRQRQLLYEDNLLSHFLQVKGAETRYFFRKLNFAFDSQKNEMFEYYKNRKAQEQSREEVVNEQPAEDGETDD